MDRINHLVITRYFVSKIFITILMNHSRFLVNRNGSGKLCHVLSTTTIHMFILAMTLPYSDLLQSPFMFAPFSAEMHVLVRFRH
jgi:hypothetical protein